MIRSPLTLKLIFPDNDYVKFMGEVKSSAVMDNRKLDSDGLYSVETFGAMGSEERMSMFGYIDLNVDILHPRLYYYFTKVSSLWKDIIFGKKYATFDKTTKTFKLSDVSNGDTGYSFFMEHVHDLNLGKSDSGDRQNMINVIKKYRKEGLLTNNKLLVLPAGLRDIDIEDSGRITEQEINDYYKAIINASSMLRHVGTDLKVVDYLRLNLQLKVDALMKELFKLINGKKKFIGGHWASRNIEYGTRNVATGKPIIITDLEEVENLDILNTASVGLFQYIKAIDPITKHNITTKFSNVVFDKPMMEAVLFDQKAGKGIKVSVPNKYIELWTTSSGLDSILNRFADDSIKNEPIMVGDYWFMGVMDNGSHIELITDPMNMSDEFKGSKVRGLTYGEMFYISIYDVIKKYYGTITRYPVTGQGSIIPTKILVNTTVKTRDVSIIRTTELGKETFECKKYPILGLPYDSSLSPSYSRTKGLGLDFDGDKIGLNILFSKEATMEMESFINDKRNYILPDGTPSMELADYPVELVIKTLSRIR